MSRMAVAVALESRALVASQRRRCKLVGQAIDAEVSRRDNTPVDQPLDNGFMLGEIDRIALECGDREMEKDVCLHELRVVGRRHPSVGRLPGSGTRLY